ncbi:MAG: FKBP-type peptidyl-prolyl cis-trans isomerase [Thermoplasmatota archaeon]
MVNKGSIIRVDFEAWTDDGQLFDTTRKDVAKASGKLDERIDYTPMPAIVGVGRLVPGFDKAIMDAKVGEAREVTVPPSEAFGEKDPTKFETLSMREFQKQDVQPYPGMRLNFQGKSGTVVSVAPGRVRVDLNAPLAGKTLTYKFTVVEEIEKPEAKVLALVEMDYGPTKGAPFQVEVTGDVAVIKLPDACKYDQRWFVAKYRLVSDLRNYAGVKTCRFVEEYVTEEAGAPVAHSPDEPSDPSAEHVHDESAPHNH